MRPLPRTCRPSPRGIAAAWFCMLALAPAARPVGADTDPSRPLFRVHSLAFDAGPHPARVATGDLNGDGKPDLVVGDSDLLIFVLLNRGNSVFGPAIVSPVALPIGGLVIGDFTGDGIPDVAIADYSNDQVTNTVTIFRGLGNGHLSQVASYPVGKTPNDLVAGYIDDDAILDLVTANQNADSTTSVSVLLGHGDGTFDAARSVNGGTHAYAVAVGDVDHDGAADLAVANTSSGTASVLLGNGDGTFEARRVFGAGLSPVSVAFENADGDPYPDLLVANYLSGNVTVLGGNGAGSFALRSTFDVAPGPLAMRVVDFDHDGRPDVTTISETDHTVTVSMGHGNGTFGNALAFGVGILPVALAADDVNQDGWPDVVTANQNQNTVSVFLGNGDGTLGTRPDSLISGPRPPLVAIADLNRD